jgi:hypothetical protein
MFDFKHRSSVRYAVLADLMRDKQGEIWTPSWKRIFLGYSPSFSSLLYGARKDLQLVWQTQNQYRLQFKLLAGEWQSPLFWDQLQVIILMVSSIVLQWAAAASFASVYLWLQFGLLDVWWIHCFLVYTMQWGRCRSPHIVFFSEYWWCLPSNYVPLPQ